MILSELFHTGNIKRRIEVIYKESHDRYYVIFTYPDYINKKTLKPMQYKRDFTSIRFVREYLFYFLTAKEYEVLSNIKREDLINEVLR